jgi:hypothetical protein
MLVQGMCAFWQRQAACLEGGQGVARLDQGSRVAGGLVKGSVDACLRGMASRGCRARCLPKDLRRAICSTCLQLFALLGVPKVLHHLLDRDQKAMAVGICSSTSRASLSGAYPKPRAAGQLPWVVPTHTQDHGI